MSTVKQFDRILSATENIPTVNAQPISSVFGVLTKNSVPRLLTITGNATTIMLAQFLLFLRRQLKHVKCLMVLDNKNKGQVDRAFVKAEVIQRDRDAAKAIAAKKKTKGKTVKKTKELF